MTFLLYIMVYMKNFVPAFLFSFLFLIAPVLVQANTVVRTGELISVTDEQQVDGNFYALGSSLALSGKVNGDIVAAAGTVSINAPVANDVLVLGGTVGINDTVTEDVRIVGGDVTISSDVSGSVFVLGGRLHITSTAHIKGDVLVVTGDAVVEGVIDGKLLGVSERVRVDSQVASINMNAADITLGDRTVVSGDVSYTGNNDLVRAPGATVAGSIVRNSTQAEKDDVSPYRATAMAFLVSLFASLSLYLVFRRQLVSYARHTTQNIAKEGFIGFGALVAVPVAIIVLTVSVLGLFLGLIGLALFLLCILVGIPLMNVVVAALLARTFQDHTNITSLHITVGAAVVQIMTLVPVIGPSLLLVLFFVTVGGLITGLYSLLKSA